eukprot:374537-Rhodomonas_salina.1
MERIAGAGFNEGHVTDLEVREGASDEAVRDTRACQFLVPPCAYVSFVLPVSHSAMRVCVTAMRASQYHKTRALPVSGTVLRVCQQHNARISVADGLFSELSI